MDDRDKADDAAALALVRSGVEGLADEALRHPERMGDMAELLEGVDELLAPFATPAEEWSAVVAALGHTLVAALVSVPEAWVRNYASGERATPDEVADRLHVLSLIVDDLVGSYDAAGAQRWFHRKRPQLDGRSPAEVLSEPWTSASPDAARVHALAHALTGPLAT